MTNKTGPSTECCGTPHTRDGAWSGFFAAHTPLTCPGAWPEHTLDSLVRFGHGDLMWSDAVISHIARNNAVILLVLVHTHAHTNANTKRNPDNK